MAFMSCHTKDNPRPKIDVEVIEKDLDAVSEFEGFPILVSIDGLHVYLRKPESEKLWELLGAALHDLDLQELKKSI